MDARKFSSAKISTFTVITKGLSLYGKTGIKLHALNQRQSLNYPLIIVNIIPPDQKLHIQFYKVTLEATGHFIDRLSIL